MRTWLLALCLLALPLAAAERVISLAPSLSEIMLDLDAADLLVGVLEGDERPAALAHLPTYQWDLVQCLAIIGSARLVLSLAYLFSRNLGVSTGADVLNDWTLFGISLILVSLPH